MMSKQNSFKRFGVEEEYIGCKIVNIKLTQLRQENKYNLMWILEQQLLNVDCNEKETNMN